MGIDNLSVKRIQTVNNSDIPSLITLYESSFPFCERRDSDELSLLIENSEQMHFNAIYLEKEICGLLIFWELSFFKYLEHFAIFENIRNKGVGSKTLDFIESSVTGIRIFEIEPPNDEYSKRRLNLYLRNGYTIVDKAYMQPTYHKNGYPIPLWLMSNVPIESEERRMEIVREIREKVYFSIED